MKKKLLVISFLITFPFWGYAQYTTVITDVIGSCFPASPTNSIVRNWPEHDYAVTYSFGPTGGRVFCAIKYTDYITSATSPSFPVCSVPIPAPLTNISDFRIIGEYVCFCGALVTYSPVYSATGYIGCFKISELISGTTVNYKLIKIDDCDLLEKIEGFCDDHGFKIFAIGQHVTSNGEHYAIYEVDDPPTATSYSCKYALLSLQQPGQHEFFDDIVVLEDRVVFVCSHHNTTPPAPYTFWGPIEMRWVKKSLGLSDSQLNTRYYQTSSSAMPEREINSRIMAKPIDGESFVIGYTYSTIPDGVSTRRLRVFDINLNNVNSQEFPIYSKFGMKEMVYNKGLDVLTVLEPDGITSRFVFAQPLNTSPYTALTLNDPSFSHLSLDTISSKQFIATRVNNWILQNANQISYNPSTTSNNCIDDESVEVAIIPHLEKDPYYYPLNDAPGGNDFSVSNTVQMCTVKEKCVSQ